MSRLSVGYDRTVYVSIEGVYGVGKSTLVEALSTAPNVVSVPEWSSLSSHASRFESAPLPPRSLEEARRGIDFFFSMERERVESHNGRADAVIVDRSPFSVIAVEMALERMGYPADVDYAWHSYHRNLRHGSTFPIDAFVLLTCDSERDFRSRLANKRNLHPFLAQWEIAEAVQAAYVDAFKRVPSDSVLHISASEPFDDVLIATAGFLSVVSFVHREEMLLTSLFGETATD